MKRILLTTIIFNSLIITSQNINSILNHAKDAVITNSTSIIDAAKTNSTNVIDKTTGIITGNSKAATLTNDDVIKGLKEALSIGTNNSTTIASKPDGFLKNQKIYIPWPSEAQDMKNKLIKMGMQKKVTDFETSLNKAAEEASKKAAPIFLDAITNMSISDGFNILNGSDTSATHYLREKTTLALKEKFTPTIKEAVNKAKVASYWKPLATAYNTLPGVKKQNPNLDEYICVKTINGLMLLIQDEEVKIRKDPAARITDLLKKVFGSKK